GGEDAVEPVEALPAGGRVPLEVHVEQDHVEAMLAEERRERVRRRRRRHLEAAPAEEEADGGEDVFVVVDDEDAAGHGRGRSVRNRAGGVRRRTPRTAK